MPAYYNEFDHYAAQWLRNLISAGHIAPGDVDERSIHDVKPDDLKGYTQAHFFAGIGGWSLAARLAGWPDDKPLWTGSCPCQPFSAAGKRKGTADERHLWPVFAALIRECRPPVVAGEQVASKDGLGWFDGVCADLEAADYAWWAGDYCAAGVGAPHIRQRLWWLGHANNAERPARHVQPVGTATRPERVAQSGPLGWLADAGCVERERRPHEREPDDQVPAFGGKEVVHDQRRGGDGFWSRYELVPCRDGTARRIEPGVFPLAHGVSGRVGRLRAYGNAIVPQVAAEVLAAYLGD